MKNKLLTLLLCLFSTLAFADGNDYEINMNQSYKYSKKRSIDANYDAGKDYTLKLEGKFSDYKIANWNEDRISFHVEIIAKSNKESYLDKILSSIDVILSDINKSKASKIVEAKTKIDNCKLNNASISIDYYIMIPNDIDIIIDNTYGDVDIQSAKDIKIKLMYGDSDISSADNIDAEILYGDITIGTVNYFDADVKYSEIDCSMAKKVEAEVMYSDTYFKTVDEIRIDNMYGDLEIENLINKIECSLKYSDIEIENVDKNFSDIIIDAMYSDVSISLTNEHCFSYDISASYGNIFPKMLKDNANKYIKEHTETSVIGNINDNDKLHNIKIDALYGDVEIDFE